jgi:hypothetical protein
MIMPAEPSAAPLVAPQVLLSNHLKALKLPTFAREYEKVAKESARSCADSMATFSYSRANVGSSVSQALTPNIYPIATIFIAWVLSGHAGPAESALGLVPNLAGLLRCLIAVCVVFQGVIIWRLFRRQRQKSTVWDYAAAAMDTRAAASIDAVIAVGAVAGAAALTVLFGSPGTGAIAFGVAVVAAVASAGRVAGAVAVAVAIPAAFGLAFGLGGASQSTVAVVAVIAAASDLGILLLCALAIRFAAQGIFFLLFIPLAIAACFASVGILLPLKTWPQMGPLLLFQGLLTLINAPFNWVSIGVTRALLRRGLELGGVWPYFLAIAL